MATANAWEKLATISKDRGEYFPELDPRVGKWNKEEELFIKRNLDDNKKVVLDLGCGDGRALVWLSERGFEKLYGLDISKTCIANARKKLGAHVNLAVWNYKKGLPYKIKFDRVLLMGNTVIADLEEPVKLLKAIKGVLKDDGLLFITCWNGKFLTRKFIDSYYGKLGVLKVKSADLENRIVDFGGIVNKWLIESELRDMIKEAGLKVKVLRKASVGLLCAASK